MADPKTDIGTWCRDGDESAFRRFYEEQAPKLWKFLIARGCRRDVAYDLLADAFLRFIQVVCKDPYAPVALLYRIAVNLRIDAYRREQIAATDAIEDPDTLPAPSGESDGIADLRALIRGLPEGEQNLLLLRYGIGLSHKEVAQSLGLPEGTVRRRCAEAIGKLRERFGGSEDDHAVG